MVKLNAFLDLYLSGLPEEKTADIRLFWNSWNERINEKPISDRRVNLDKISPEWTQYATDWFKKLTDREDLASRLLRFINTLR